MNLYDHTEIIEKNINKINYKKYICAEELKEELDFLIDQGVGRNIKSIDEIYSIIEVYGVRVKPHPEEYIREHREMMYRIIDESVPNRKEIKNNIINDMTENYLKLILLAPTAEDFISRAIHKHAPEFSDCSIRVALLKKALKEGGDCDSKRLMPIRHFLLDDKKKKIKYEQLGRRERGEYLAELADESVFSSFATAKLDIDIKRIDCFLNKTPHIKLNKDDKSEVHIDDLRLSEKRRGELISIAEDLDIEIIPESNFELLCRINEGIKSICCEKDASKTIDRVRHIIGKEIKAFGKYYYEIEKGINKGKLKTFNSGKFRDIKKNPAKNRTGGSYPDILKSCLMFDNTGYMWDNESNRQNKGSTRKEAYYLGYILKMDEDSFRKEILSDVYAKNFASLYQHENEELIRFEPFMDQTENHKNYAEVVYSFYMNRKIRGDDGEYLSADSLFEKAENMIENLASEYENRRDEGEAFSDDEIDNTSVFLSEYSEVKDEDEGRLFDLIINNWNCSKGNLVGGTNLSVCSENRRGINGLNSVMKLSECLRQEKIMQVLSEYGEVDSEEVVGFIRGKNHGLRRNHLKNYLEGRSFESGEKIRMNLCSIDSLSSTGRNEFIRKIKTCILYSERTIGDEEYMKMMNDLSKYLPIEKLYEIRDCMVELKGEVEAEKDFVEKYRVLSDRWMWTFGDELKRSVKSYEDQKKKEIFIEKLQSFLCTDMWYGSGIGEEDNFPSREKIITAVAAIYQMYAHEGCKALLNIRKGEALGELEIENISDAVRNAEEFKDAVDSLLVNTRYPVMNRKNLFDTYVYYSVIYKSVEYL